MAAPVSATELTLIVAATRSMGIGAKGGLPWTGLKREMAYFARVTKRLPSQTTPGALNAVIMGRKTWDSIPPKFRPLKGRLNVVISRSLPPSPTPTSAAASTPAVDVEKEPFHVSSLEEALRLLEAEAGGSRLPLGKVFVIGGAQIYSAALALDAAKRVLLTKVVDPDFECDAFFPLELEGAEGEGGKGSARDWVRRDKLALDGWVGEDVPAGEQEENGTRYEFQMWERQGSK